MAETAVALGKLGLWSMEAPLADPGQVRGPIERVHAHWQAGADMPRARWWLPRPVPGRRIGRRNLRRLACEEALLISRSLGWRDHG